MTVKLLTRTTIKRLLKIADDRLWNGNLALRDDGVYRLVPAEELRADLPLNEFQSIGEPELVLALPCTREAFAAFANFEGLMDPYVQRHLQWGARGGQPPATHAGASKVRAKGRMLANRESVLAAIADMGLDPLAIPAYIKGNKPCPVMKEAERLSGLSDKMFKHAWYELMKDESIRRVA